jgi:uncharacterized membrane protein
MDDFRRFFLRGLGALLPTLLTIAVLIWAYHVVNDYVGTYVTKGMLFVCSSISPRPAPGFVNMDVDPIKYGTPVNEWDHLGRRLTIEYKMINHPILGTTPSTYSPNKKAKARAEKARDRALWQIASAKYKLHLLGFLIAIILVYFVGFFLASFIGRTSWRMAEGLLFRIPLIRAVYPNIKQVTDFLLAERRFEFSSVVAVQYPRKGVWSLGLRTGKPMKQVQSRVSEELVSVFIPSSPTPVTGYVIQIAKEDVIDLSISLDEALRFTISAGVIKPSEDSKLPLPPVEEA